MSHTFAKFPAAAIAMALFFHPWNAPAAESDFKGQHDAGGIVIEPHEGELQQGEILTITFPTAMVKTEAIQEEGHACPFAVSPKLPGKFLWKSQTEGEFTVGKPLAPGTHYRLSLDPALKDLAGNPVHVKNWGAEFVTNAFSIAMNSDDNENTHLSSRQQVHLTASYPVDFAEAAEHIYFQDHDSQERHATQVILGEHNSDGDETEFSVEPREDLPVGRTFDLVVDGLTDLNAHKPLPWMPVFPLGSTHPMKVEWVGAVNYAMDEPQIIVKLDDRISPDAVTADTVKIDPPVKNFKAAADDDEITLTGDFDTTARYGITIAGELKGARGYTLAAGEKWHATFKPKKPAVIFPGEQIFERTGRGLRFSFLQINAPKLQWNLAVIPPEKLAAVSARVREFQNDATDPFTGKTVIDPRTGFNKPQETELLTSAFDLKPAATGEFDATTGDKEVMREINWQSGAAGLPTGAYLLEVSGKGGDGRIVGNRSIVCFSDLILTQKRTDSSVLVRVSKMSDGLAVPDVAVRVVSEKNAVLGRAVSDQRGIATFPRELFSYTKKERAHLFIADTPGGPALQFVDASPYPSGSPVDWVSNKDASASKQGTLLRSAIVTDRNLYRPSQTVKFKGMLRIDKGGALSIPDKPVHWWITLGSREDVLAEGNATLNENGGWEGAWEVPAKAELGDYALHCEAAGLQALSNTPFRVDEYRVPLFSVIVDAENKVGAYSEIKVSSAYFHGAPNRGARLHWKATWETLSTEGDGGVERYDGFTERDPHLAQPQEAQTAEGDAALDANGVAVVKSDAPFTDGVPRGRCAVTWRVDVTSAEGQTITGGNSADVQFVPMLPGIRANEEFSPQRSVKIDLDAVDPDNKPASGLDLQADLYHVTSKTVKEKVSAFVYRYRNTTLYTKVGTQSGKVPVSLLFPVRDTGRYIAVATAPGQEHTLPVSTEVDVSGVEPAELPVQNETSFQITHDDKKFVPGETAVLHTQAPFGGVAWVSVESNEILDTLLVPIAGNSGRIELPIKKEYGPNAFVSVYLVKPGGADALPLERFAFTSINVRVPGRELNITSKIEKETVRPGDIVRGELAVASAGKPVAGAEVAVFAVDDAVLQLGGWTEPDLGAVFYPQRRFGVLTYSALDRYVADIKRESLTEKGFVVGGGGEETFGNVKTVRKEFETLAFWKSDLKSDDSGKIKFEFKAPDNLTTYRIVAAGQTAENQFGVASDATVKISKPLIAEPALPRFLRDGDEVELRVVTRENFADSDEITVRCVPDARLQIEGPAEATQKTVRNVPTVFHFKAKVADPEFASATVRFDAVSKSNREAYDSVENTLPVHPPVIVRNESVAGTFNGPAFDPAQKLPEAWSKGRGHYDLTVSTSPWLPEIAGLPLILDYPHGCFDQISTRMLSYALLRDLLAYLPNAEARDKNYRSVIQNGLKLFNQSVKPDGMLPYWDGQEQGSPFCTVEALWALNEIAKSDFEIPGDLQDKIGKAVKEIGLGHAKADLFTQCFALMVLSQDPRHENYSNVVQDLYLKRRAFDDEARALLSLAMQNLNIMPDQKNQLLREIGADPIRVRAFDPLNFSSANREEAIRALAFCKTAPPEYLTATRKHLAEIMDSAGSLSTQENLWLLLAFKAYQDTQHVPKLQVEKTAQMALSGNGASAGWPGLPIPPAGDVSLKGLNTGAPLSYLMAAQYMDNRVDTDREDKGFRVERVVRNLTDPKRTGTAEAPFKLGDEIFISYRIFTRKLQNYVALEDQLPAALESVNPDLAMVGKFYSIPNDDPQAIVLPLAHSEMHDEATRVYFDAIEPGTDIYGVLARATCAGTFRWPSTSVVPMYDSRFSGISPASICVVTGD